MQEVARLERRSLKMGIYENYGLVDDGLVGDRLENDRLEGR